MNSTTITTLALFSVLSTAPLDAQRSVRGESSRSGFSVAGERITSARAKWLLSTLLGEATKRGDFKYTTASGRKLPWDTYLILRVRDGSGGGGFISVAPDRVPSSGRGYGGSTGSSPRWSRFIAKRVRDGRLVDYYDAKTAKAAYKRGLRVVEWYLSVPGGKARLQRILERREAERKRRSEQRRQRSSRYGSTGRNRSSSTGSSRSSSRPKLGTATPARSTWAERAARQRASAEAARRAAAARAAASRAAAARAAAARQAAARERARLDRERRMRDRQRREREQRARDRRAEEQRKEWKRKLNEQLDRMKRQLDEQNRQTQKRLQDHLERLRRARGRR